MAIKYAIEKHTIAAPAKLLASEGGKHIYNVKLSEDADNGNFVVRDAWLSLDLYSHKVAGSAAFSGIVREQAANGNWYVEVVDPGEYLFVYNVPMIAEEYSNKFKAESNFYNADGDIVRAYELAVGDIIEVSDLGFSAKPSAGQTVATALVSGKTKVYQLA